MYVLYFWIRVYIVVLKWWYINRYYYEYKNKYWMYKCIIFINIVEFEIYLLYWNLRKICIKNNKI